MKKLLCHLLNYEFAEITQFHTFMYVRRPP